MAQVKKRRARNIAVLCAAIVLFAVGSTVAFLTSRDETTNRFVAGKFDIAMTETKWNPYAAVNVVPGDELPKNPRITNKERTAGYVFFRVTVPGDATAVDNGDGTSFGSSANVPLYKFMVWNGDDPATYSANTTYSASQRVRSHWIPVGDPRFNDTDKTFVYVYAYSTDGTTLTPLLEGETTPPLFDKLLVSNFSTIDPARNHSVLVEGFGIQADIPEYSASQISEIWSLVSGGGD